MKNPPSPGTLTVIAFLGATLAVAAGALLYSWDGSRIRSLAGTDAVLEGLSMVQARLGIGARSEYERLIIPFPSETFDRQPEMIRMDADVMDASDGRPERAAPGLEEVMRQYDQEVLSGWFPGLATCPRWIVASMTPLIDEPVDECGNRMLHIAARSANQYAIWGLMQLGADASILNDGRETPLQVLRCSDRSAREAIIACLQGQDVQLASLMADAQHRPPHAGAVADVVEQTLNRFLTMAVQAGNMAVSVIVSVDRG